jgi:hypothetical protein
MASNTNLVLLPSSHTTVGGPRHPRALPLPYIVSLARNSDGRLELFVRWTDNAIYHIWQKTPNGTWDPWHSLGGEWSYSEGQLRNQDKLFVFALKQSDHSVWYCHQAANSPGGWTPWIDLGGDFLGGTVISVAHNIDDRLEVFVTRADQNLWHTQKGSAGESWSAWESLGAPGGGIKQYMVLQNIEGKLTIIAACSDGLTHTLQQSVSGGGQWLELQSNPLVGGGTLGGGTPPPEPAPVPGCWEINADGRKEVFGLGSDRSLWHGWEFRVPVQITGGGSPPPAPPPGNYWSAWSPLGGRWPGTPIPCVNKDGSIEVFVKGNDSAYWHNWQLEPSGGRTGGWSGWSSLGVSPRGESWLTDPVVSQNADGRLEIFARAAGDVLWHNWQIVRGWWLWTHIEWSGWASLGGDLVSEPEVLPNADGRLEAFVMGPARNEISHIWQTTPNGQWSAWDSLGTP